MQTVSLLELTRYPFLLLIFLSLWEMQAKEAMSLVSFWGVLVLVLSAFAPLSVVVVVVVSVVVSVVAVVSSATNPLRSLPHPQAVQPGKCFAMGRVSRKDWLVS